jgi:S1-C subfamily serine protease
MRMPKLNCNRPLVWGAALAVVVSTSTFAADLTQTARDLFARNQNSLITVSALNKLDMGASGLPIRIGGLGEAQETSCNGLVLDASGLTVVSYTALNPMEKVAGALKIRMGEGDEGEEAKGTSELSRIQMRLADGTEVPGRLVFKDKELDLAFVVPDPKEGEKAPSFAPVTVASGATAKELDEIVVLGRHGKNLGYQATVDTGRITGVISKPRAMYDLSVPARPGAPVFLADGRLLGVLATASSESANLMSMAMEQLVLPSAEVVKLAEQAKKAAAKKEEKKDDKKDEKKDEKPESK